MAKVLIIESDLESAQQLQQALNAQGVENQTVTDGNEGLALVRTYEPNAIVLCVELSRVSGYSICNKLKKDPALSGIPLLLTSSQATEETFEQHKKLKTRAEGYLKKPYDIAQLLTLLSAYVPVQGAPAARAKEPTSPRVAAPAAPAKPPTSEFDFAELGNDEATPAINVARAPAPTPRHAATVDTLDLDSFDVAEPPAPTPTPRARPQQVESLDLDEDLSVPMPTQAAAKPRVKTAEVHREDVARSAPVTRPKTQDIVLDEGDSFNLDEVVPAPVIPTPRARPAEATPAALARARTDELDLDDLMSTPTPAPARPPRVVEEHAAPVGRNDGQTELLRTENRQLRQKVQQLEQTLQEKDLEFNDRLLQESARSRDGVELKKKVATLEREMSKYQQAAEKGRADAEHAAQQIVEMRARGQEFDEERQNFTDKIAQLVEKVKGLAAERQTLQQELEALKQAHQSAQQDLEVNSRSRQKAKKAVDIALQLLEETGMAS